MNVGCRRARNSMVASRDGELTARRQRALERHLDRCGACRTERVALEGVLATLDGLSLEADVPPALEHAVMRRIRALAEDEQESPRTLAWTRTLAPAVAASAVVLLAVVGLRSGEVAPPRAPTKVAVASPAAAPTARPVVARREKTRAPAEPPAALASRPDLFMDLPMLRQFEKIQHFDAIAGMDDDGVGESPSNG